MTTLATADAAWMSILLTLAAATLTQMVYLVTLFVKKK